MKAIRVHEFGPPDVMRLQEVPDPEVGVGQVVVRFRAAGVNPVDAYVRAGSYARKPSLPYTPGTRMRRSDRISRQGRHSECRYARVRFRFRDWYLR